MRLDKGCRFGLANFFESRQSPPPVLRQTEVDMLRRIWFFLETVINGSMIECIGGEKSSRASANIRNIGRALTFESTPERKAVERKVVLLFALGGLEFGCCECECGRFDDQIQRIYKGQFRMVKVLENMLFGVFTVAE